MKMFDYTSILTNPTSGDAICGGDIDEDMAFSYDEVSNLKRFSEGGVVKANAAWDISKTYLESRGYEVASIEQLVNAMIKSRGERLFGGGMVREGVLYSPQRGIFITKNSPVMGSAKRATMCSRRNERFYLSEDELEQSLKGAIKVSGKSILTERFGEDEIAIYLFGNFASELGEYLHGYLKIKQMPFFLSDNLRERPFSKQMRFDTIYSPFRIDGDSGLCKKGVFGFKKV